MKKLLTILLALLMLVGCSSNKLDKKTYEKYEFISINMYNNDGESKEFWFAIDDSGNVKDAAPTGWIGEFDEKSYSGNYQKAFDKVYEEYDGNSFSHICFAFANMSDETEKKYRKECEDYIHNLRSGLDYETASDEFDHAFQNFINFQNNKAKNADNQRHDDQQDEENHPDENLNNITIEVKNSEEFMDALTKCGVIVLKNDISVNLDGIKSSDPTIINIDCNNHSLTLTGTYEVNDNFRSIEITNPTSVDISKLIIDPEGLTPSNEKLETNKMKYESFFVIRTSYKNVKYDDSLLVQNSERNWSKIEHAPHININADGDTVSYVVRRALSYEARHEMETEYIEAYLENPKLEYDDKKIYTDIEIEFDDYDTPEDDSISFDVARTGSLKLSGKVNICGPKMTIESKTKGSVILNDLLVIRKCMSPDCIWIGCDEGIDEELMQVKTDEGAKLVAGVTEKRYAVTIWSR